MILVLTYLQRLLPDEEFLNRESSKLNKDLTREMEKQYNR